MPQSCLLSRSLRPPPPATLSRNDSKLLRELLLALEQQSNKIFLVWVRVHSYKQLWQHVINVVLFHITTANALATGGDPTPWINDMESQYQTVISALVEIKPVANAPQKDDIVDICVKIIVVSRSELYGCA